MPCPRCHSENPGGALYCGTCGEHLSSAEGVRPMAAPAPFSELTEGRIVAGKYKILQKLGEGGMGVVYKAEDIRLNRAVALKFLAPQLTTEPEYKERFAREARTASKLDHPNICTIHEIDEDENHRLFIAMALCQGRTLKEIIRTGALSPEENLDVGIQVVQGLSRAHAEGIIHRDIKPGNIMATETGDVKILDFGLAKAGGGSDVTRTAGLVGTVAYMSPEQIRSEPLDFRTDIWSLGIVLYEMMTGVHPFQGDTPEAVIFSILNRSPLPPSELKSGLPLEFDRVVFKCLRKERSERYASALVVLADLRKLKREWAEGTPPVPGGPKKALYIKKNTEQRPATVMFIEISGLSDVLETFDTQEASAIVTRCLSLFDLIDEGYGGISKKITDTGFRAVFGAPMALENAPAKALNAAIELRKAVDEFKRQEGLKTSLRLRIGINSGTVIAGVSDTTAGKEFSVMGDTVDVASQLKDLAAEGQVFVGPATYRAAKQEFDFRPLNPFFPKGRERPVSVFELLSAREKTARRYPDSERMISSELVGRGDELDTLQLHVMKAINGQGSIVSLSGDAGVGKSRLIAELKAQPIMKKVSVLEGRALSIGKNLSFHPLVDLLKNWAGIGEDDTAPEAYRKLERAVAAVGPGSVEDIFPFLATVMSMKLEGAYAERIRGIEGEPFEKLALRSLREIVEGASRQKPLIVILDDLHWADATSLKFLGSLFRLAEKNRIVFINVFRPNYEETSGRWLRAISARYGDIHTEIALSPLDEKESEELISNLLKISFLPLRVRELIQRKAEGNPFFIEAIARSFIDDGVVEIRDGRFRVTGKMEAVVVPETVNELLMARIDKLDEEARSLLKVASVIGRKFFYQILAQVAGTVSAIDDALDLLKEAQLIRERTSPEGVEYFFKHALIQEVCYESILPGTRRELHLRIANAIEALFRERLPEFYGMLAWHYGQGEDLDKAERYLIKAGEEALKASASDEALHFYKEALRIYSAKSGAESDPERIAMLQKNIALALFNRGHFTAAIEYFEKAMAFHGERTPQGAVRKALKFAWGFGNFVLALYVPRLKFRKTPSPKECEIIGLFQMKLAALSVTIPKRMFMESFYFCRLLLNYRLTEVENGIGIFTLYSSIFSWSAISFRLSRKVLDFVKDKIDAADTKSKIYFCFSKLIHDFFTGDWDGAADFDHGMIDRGLKIGEFFFTTNCLDLLCHLNIERGNLALARQFIAKVGEISDVYDYDIAENERHFLRTLFLIKLVKVPEALKDAEAGIAFAHKRGYTSESLSLGAFKAKAQVLSGDLLAARKTLQDLDKIRSSENVVPLSLSWCLTSRFLLDLGLLAEAGTSGDLRRLKDVRKRALRSGRAMLRNSRKIASERTETYRLMGVYFWKNGKQDKALKWWAKSLREGEKLGAALELSKTRLEIGQRLRDKESRHETLAGISGRQFLDMAKPVLEAWNLQADLDRPGS